jgi:hypothetical protein
MKRSLVEILIFKYLYMRKIIALEVVKIYQGAMGKLSLFFI